MFTPPKHLSIPPPPQFQICGNNTGSLAGCIVIMGMFRYQDRKSYIQGPKQTKPYSFNYLPPLIFLNAHVKSVKHAGLGNFGQWG